MSDELKPFRVVIRLKPPAPRIPKKVPEPPAPIIGQFRTHRAELRKWAADKSELVCGLADIQCRQLRVMEHEPSDELARSAFLATWVRLVQAHGEYRQH